MRPTSEFDPHEWSRVYDDPHGPGQHRVFRRSAEMAEAACAPLLRAGDQWLDIGSGTGHLTRSLRGSGAHVVGVDHDLAMLRFAGEGLAARAEQLPFADSSVHGLVAVSLMGCLQDPAPFCREAHRVLRTGGHAVLTFTNQASWLLKLNYLAAKPTGSRFVLHRASDVRAQLERAGLRIVRVRLYNSVLHAGRRVFPPPDVADLVDRMQIERLARNFVIVAIK